MKERNAAIVDSGNGVTDVVWQGSCGGEKKRLSRFAHHNLEHESVL